ncbi:probable inactive receptor-like protein kinase At3g56050 isoform X2 [Durio zibethinus]|uniref:Probable inactive receptor-like protein kinase At3g56050 isoform X2 n=1 Tax=Durio zibethinus TaxID=66656 RepID=A0A6P5YQU0_DURZI|nr:probable inactive receptor-like protein kinase At3g56050 isoform X2 [Durio zibethinus]
MIMNNSRKFVRLRLEFGVGVVLFLLCQSLVCWSLNEEGLALLRLRERVVNDPFGGLSNWKEEDGEVDHCSWFGVECSDGKVVVLNLKDLGLEGTLAPELGTLVHIKSIILRNNSFTGIIPEGIGELKELEVLDLGYNKFSGPLPPELGSNLSLTILLLDNNEFLSSFSPEIYELQKLSETQVDENQLSIAAKLSCKKRFNSWNAGQSEDAVQRRLLQEIPDIPAESPKAPFLNFNIPLSPSHAPQFLTPSASAEPSTRTFARDAPVQRPSFAPAPSPSENNTVLPNVSAPYPSGSNPSSFHSSSKHGTAILAGLIGGSIFLLILLIISYLFKTLKVSTVKPWATGLSGQLQKVFVTGVPKLKRSELEAACEDFCNVIGSSTIGTMYKGTLSNGVEIAVASVPVKYAKDWSKNLETKFRQKIDTLSKVNHKNFVNLLGYCEEDEPFTRMMVFEYAPNGTLFEHLHIKESEPLDWAMRLRIVMGMAYCLEHMHQLNPPLPLNNLSSSAVNLTEDYAAKISDLCFWNEITATERESDRNNLSDTPLASLESNVYTFGVLLFEIVTGRMPYLADNDSLEDWALDYLRREQALIEMVDPTLKCFNGEQLEKIGEVIKSCIQPEPRQRPDIREVSTRLREITAITPDGAIPKLSPLWWAELEIMSPEES